MTLKRKQLLDAIRRAFREHSCGMVEQHYGQTRERIRRAKRMTARDRALVFTTPAQPTPREKRMA